ARGCKRVNVWARRNLRNLSRSVILAHYIHDEKCPRSAGSQTFMNSVCPHGRKRRNPNPFFANAGGDPVRPRLRQAASWLLAAQLVCFARAPLPLPRTRLLPTR